MSVCSDYYPGWHRSILSSAFHQAFLCRRFLSGSHILDHYVDLFLSVSLVQNNILAILLVPSYNHNNYQDLLAPTLCLSAMISS